MRILPRSHDTIAVRFALTVVLAVACTLLLVELFLAFGGVWAQEPLDHTNLHERGGDLVRVIEAAPPQLRPTLAAAATREMVVSWYEAASPVAGALVRDSRPAVESDSLLQSFLGHSSRPAVIFEPHRSLKPPPQLLQGPLQSRSAYLVGVELKDGSWVVFGVANRLWGLSGRQRWFLWLTFAVPSIALVCTIATRKLVRPIRQLADAVRRFGVNPQAPALQESGPKEFQDVVGAFNTMQAQIQKFVTYRVMMLAAISHDLRTPLTRVRLRGELIEDEGQRRKLFRDVDEMTTMVDGALAFFRGDADEEATTSFDLAGVLQTIVNDFADQGVAIGYQGPVHAIHSGRPFALKRALTNLVDNAVKYGALAEIDLHCADSLIRIAVRDRGPGIPREALERVFAPFYRLDRSRNRATGGVGLGLTAAQAILRSHGGEIALSNRVDGGLEAVATLPRVA